jgi:hypothetical protein
VFYSFGSGFLVKPYALMFLHFRYRFVISQTHFYKADYITSIILHGEVNISHRRRKFIQ